MGAFHKQLGIKSLQPKGKVRPEHTDLVVINVVRPVRVDEIIQGKQNGKNFNNPWTARILGNMNI